MLRPNNKRINDFVEAFDGEKVDSDADMQVIPPGGRSTCMFTPYLGLLTQDRYLPLRYAPITLELEICNLATDPIVEPSGTAHTAANSSDTWEK